MPRPRKKRHRERNSGSITWCARLKRWEARLPRSLGRSARYFTSKDAADGWLRREIAAREKSGELPGAGESLVVYLKRWTTRMETVFGPARMATTRQMAVKAEPLWNVRLCDLKYQHVADWVAGLLRAGAAPSSTAGYKQLLSQALGDLVPDVLPANPAARTIRMPKPEGAEVPAHLEALEAQRLLRATRGTRGYPLWRLLLGTGLRVGEALGLRWEDLDLDRGLASFDEQWNTRQGRRSATKARDTRTVALTAEVLDALLALPHRTGLLFPGRNPARPIGKSTVNVWFNEAVEKAGLPSEFTPHALRHTFASLALSRNTPVTDVAQTLGHSNPSTTTRVYAHALRQRRGAAERALADALAEVSDTDLGPESQHSTNRRPNRS